MTDIPDDLGFDFPVAVDGGFDRVPANLRFLYSLDPETGAARMIEPLAKKVSGDGLKTALLSERQRRAKASKPR